MKALYLLSCVALCCYILVLNSIICTSVRAEPMYSSEKRRCPAFNKMIMIKSVRASAGFFSNLREAQDSLRYQTKGLLHEGRIRAYHLRHKQYHASCRYPCSKPEVGVRFISTPHKTLTHYTDAKRCNELEKTTSINPIVYSQREFTSEDAARSWYRKLSTGSGPDGRDLYRRCPGDCSPSYDTKAFWNDGKINLTTSIVCGPARDKRDGLYKLSLGLEWFCPEVD